MQTFLVSPNFDESAKVLDNKRLSKQRVEAYQILKAITDPNCGWQFHPCVNMWRGYERALHAYAVEICVEWRRRGYKDTMLDKLGEMYQSLLKDKPYVSPQWLGNPEFHASHRSNLKRKNPEWYSRFGWSEPDNLEYVWPKGETT